MSNPGTIPEFHQPTSADIYDAIRHDHGVTRPLMINGQPAYGMRLTDNRIQNPDKALSMAYAGKPYIDGVIEVLDSRVGDAEPEGVAYFPKWDGFSKDPAAKLLTSGGEQVSYRDLKKRVAIGNKAADYAGVQWEAEESRAAKLEAEAAKLIEWAAEIRADR